MTDLSCCNCDQLKTKSQKRTRGAVVLDKFSDDELAAARSLLASEEGSVRSSVEVRGMSSVDSALHSQFRSGKANVLCVVCTGCHLQARLGGQVTADTWGQLWKQCYDSYVYVPALKRYAATADIGISQV